MISLQQAYRALDGIYDVLVKHLKRCQYVCSFVALCITDLQHKTISRVPQDKHLAANYTLQKKKHYPPGNNHVIHL